MSIKKTSLSEIKINLIKEVKFNFFEKRLKFLKKNKIQKYLNIHLESQYNKKIKEYYDLYLLKYEKVLKDDSIDKSEELDRKSKIIKLCRSKKINNIMHFTNIKNLNNILAYGLLSVDQQKEHNIIAEINDYNRYDNHTNYTSFSLEFPNYKFFYRLRDNSKNIYVILVLKQDILWKKERLYCSHNAADSRIRNINVEYLSSIEALESMFEKEVQIERKDLNIPDNYTTNPQAEVLVKGNIELEYIKGIIFDIKDYLENKNLIEKYKDLYLSKGIRVSINSKYFKARSDYKEWS